MYRHWAHLTTQYTQLITSPAMTQGWPNHFDGILTLNQRYNLTLLYSDYNRGECGTSFKSAEIKTKRPTGFFQFQIIIPVLVSSFRFIWIPMLWVYGHYKYFTLSVRISISFSAGIDLFQCGYRSLSVRVSISFSAGIDLFQCGYRSLSVRVSIPAL